MISIGCVLMRWAPAKFCFVIQIHHECDEDLSKVLSSANSTFLAGAKFFSSFFCINSRARVPATIVLNEYSQFCFWINILVLGLTSILNSFAAFLHKFQRKSKSASQLLHLITISSRPLQTWVTLQNKFPLLWGKSCRYLGAKRPTQFERDWILKLWRFMFF